MRSCATILVLACAFTASQPARADLIVFSNLVSGGGYDGTTGYTIGNLGAGANYVYAVEFTTSTGPVRLSSISVALGEVGATGDPVDISLASNSGGSPGAILESLQAAVPGNYTTGGSLVTVNSVATPLLQANSQYWLEVSAVNSSQYFGWFFNSQGASGSVGVSTDGGMTYSVGPDTQGAFAIRGNLVPEPSSFVLCALAGLAVAGWRFRHRTTG
jgi:hypothetical protein